MHIINPLHYKIPILIVCVVSLFLYFFASDLPIQNSSSTGDVMLETEVVGPLYELKLGPYVNTLSSRPMPGNLIYDGHEYKAEIRFYRDRFNVKLDKLAPISGYYEFDMSSLRIDEAMSQLWMLMLMERMGILTQDIVLATVKSPAGLLTLMELYSPLDSNFLQRAGRSDGKFFLKKNGLSAPGHVISFLEDITNENSELVLDLLSLARWQALRILIGLGEADSNSDWFYDYSRNIYEKVVDLRNDYQLKLEEPIRWQLLDEFGDALHFRIKRILLEIVNDKEFINKFKEHIRNLGFTDEMISKAEEEMFIKKINSRSSLINAYLRKEGVSLDGATLLSSTFKLGNVYTHLIKKGLSNYSSFRFPVHSWSEMRFDGKEHFVNNNLYIRKNEVLKIDPGAKFIMAPKTSIICDGRVEINGTDQAPVVFKSQIDSQPWGAFVIRGRREGEKPSYMSHVEIDGGSMFKDNNALYTGALSVYDAEVELNHVVVMNTSGDDGLNARYSSSKVANCIFKNNKGDAIDFDYAGGLIENSEFVDNGGDGIDLSFSETKIMNNTISNSADKGISVGEKSIPLIDNNIISNNRIGIAVKDLSVGNVQNTLLKDNDIGIAIYQKKAIFGTGDLKEKKIVFKNNGLKYAYECDDCL